MSSSVLSKSKIYLIHEKHRTSDTTGWSVPYMYYVHVYAYNISSQQNLIEALPENANEQLHDHHQRSY